jgi:L-ribulose-5-phosphate 3-epimerase
MRPMGALIARLCPVEGLRSTVVVGARFAYVTSGLSGHRLEDALTLLADSGYDGIALTLDHVHFDPLAPRLRARAERLARLLDGLGLARVVETDARFALDPRRQHFPSLLSDGRQRRLEFMRRAIDVAGVLGAPVVTMRSGVVPASLDPVTAWALLLDGCERLLPRAERWDVRLGMEPEPGMLIERIQDFEMLARRLGGPARLGLTLDLGHCAAVEPEPVAACVTDAAGRLVHVHVKDVKRGGDEALMLGEGELDLPAALGALDEARYDGLVAVELPRHALAAHEAVPGAIARLREAERDAAPVQRSS